MFRRLVFLALVFAAPGLAQAQSLDGDWNGTLSVPQGTLHLSFEFRTENGSTSATIVSIDQGNSRIPARSVQLDAGKVTLFIPTISASYHGTLSADGNAITGTWTQSAADLPLNLARGTTPTPPEKVFRKPDPGDATLNTPTGSLSGTLAGPNTTPAVLIIPGSGPVDRDGNAPPSVQASTYRLLAEGLAARSITTLRADKRGVGESAAAMTDVRDFRFQGFVDDAKAWAAELRRRTGAKCIWLLGHSEGALIAEVAASQQPEGICGLILVAGAGRKAGVVLREQMGARFPAPLKEQGFAVLDKLEAGQTVSNPPKELMGLFPPAVQPYVISWLPLDPAAILGQIKLPVLILRGENDLQVSSEDAQGLAAAQPNAKLVALPGVNHMLKSAPADTAANIATYTNPNLPLAPGVIDAIVSFIVSHKA